MVIYERSAFNAEGISHRGVRKMKRITPILAVLISSLLISQPVFAGTLQTQTYSALASSSIVPLLSHSDVTTVGNIDGSKNLDITISLKLRNKEALKQKIDLAHSKKISGKIVSDQDMVTSYLPVANSQSKIILFLKSKGLQVTKTSGNRMSIKVQGTAKAIEDAFNVKINNYTEKGKQFFANSTEPQLPSTIASEIESIDGLNNLQLKPSYSMSSLTPSTVKTQYDIASVHAANINGKGVKLAIATYCDFDLNDAVYFLNAYGINVVSPVTTIHINGTPIIDASSAMETMLDVESALSTAPGAELLIYDGATPSSTTGIDVFSKIVDDGEADVVSYSWGANESGLSSSNVNAMNSLFVAGSAKGMTFMAATGDSGSRDIFYPATDPYVTAVGGTTLNIDGSSGEFVSEVGWSGSSGGVSSLFAKPSWQQGVANSPTYARTVPDVSLDADPNTGYSVYVGGIWYNMGGTSGSAPHWAGIMALVDQSRANNGLGALGLANPALYSSKVRAAYKDITSGSNGLYSCYEGYDMVTGWGSVDVAKLVNILSTYTEDTVVAAPSGTVASGISDSAVNITWNSVIGASYYKIYKYSLSTGLYTVIANTANTSFSDTGLAPSTYYYYKVSAVGTLGEGVTSPIINGLTLSKANILVTGVGLNKNVIAVNIGSNETLSAVVAPANATDKYVYWYSSNTAVATVDSNGKVVGVSAGTAVITVTTLDGNKTVTCTVTVTEIVPPRLAGNTATETAVAIADQTGWTGTAILASSATYGMVDALTAGPLSYYLKAPILLTGAGNALDAATKDELGKLDVNTVYVTSGTAVIKQTVLNELKAMNITVAPLGGVDRFDTSVNIAKKMVGVTKVAVANGLQDALSIASIASAANEPILLTNKAALPASVVAYLAANPGITVSDVIGGTGVISDVVTSALPNATRHYGDTAYDTNNKVIQDFVSSIDFGNVYVANGKTGIDALAGAPLAAQTKSAIVLTNGTLPAAATFVNGKLASNSVVTALGGAAVVPDSVIAGIAYNSHR